MKDRDIERHNVVPGKIPSYLWSAVEFQELNSHLVMMIGFKDRVDVLDRELRNSPAVTLPFTSLVARLAKPGVPPETCSLGLLIAAQVPDSEAAKALALRFDQPRNPSGSATEIRKALLKNPEYRPKTEMTISNEDVYELCKFFLHECERSAKMEPQ